MNSKHLSALLILSTSYSCDALSQQDQDLFSVLPDVAAKQAVRTPKINVTREWDVEFNTDLIDTSLKEFSFVLPDTLQPIEAIRTHYQDCDKNHRQWAGDIVSANGTVSGEMLINIVNGIPFGIITTDIGTYEIHTDDRVGTRLQKIQSASSFLEHDFITQDDGWGSTGQTARLDVLLEMAKGRLGTPAISNVDVLVIMDTELQGMPAEIAEIQSGFCDANYILQNSGPNGVDSEVEIGAGVPLRLTMRGPVFVDIPDQWEIITNSSSSLATLTDGSNATSFTVKEELVSAGADYAAIFTDFVPTIANSGVCGRGNIPATSVDDLSFGVSATINSVHCPLSQFVLLHELVHNFGSRHDSDSGDQTVPFVTHARGVTVAETKNNPAFATLMGGCVESGVEPSVTDCGRLPKLSSPHDSHLGIDLGTEDVADNAAFLSDCSSEDCRRQDLASRNLLNASVDFRPLASVASPETVNGSATISQTAVFELTAQVVEDFPGLEAEWKITRLTPGGGGQLVDIGAGTGNNYSYTTSAFSTLGTYRVTLTVEDSSGQTHGESVYIDVEEIVVVTLPDPYDDTVNGPRPFNDDAKGRGKLWTGPAVNNDIHNLHEQGDQDWTIIVAEDFSVRVHRFDPSFQPKIKLFKWISAVSDEDLGYFTNVNDVLLEQTLNPWSVPVKNFATESGIYAVKVVSPGHQQFGDETEYQLLFESIPTGTPDAYEYSTPHSDDNEGTPVVWQGATDVVHEQNIHDNNDVDWTLVYTSSFTAQVEEVGPDSDIKITAYRWDDAEYVNGVWINIVKQEVARDWSGSNSPTVSVNTSQADTYLIKVESRNGSFGDGTTYRLRLY